jgi:hypothetical protein
MVQSDGKVFRRTTILAVPLITSEQSAAEQIVFFCAELPSWSLLAELMARLATQNVMCFGTLRASLLRVARHSPGTNVTPFGNLCHQPTSRRLNLKLPQMMI